MPSSRFNNVVFFHGKGELPSGNVAQLESILKNTYPSVHFSRPFIPDFTTEDAFSWVSRYVSAIKSGSLIVGVERGGLLACALQAAFPALNLSVVALNAPTQDGISAYPCPTGDVRRVAFYSHAYPPIRMTCQWRLASQVAFDLEWMSTGKNHFHALCYLVSAFMQGIDLTKAMRMLFPVK